MKKIKKVSILLLTMASLVTTAACDFSLKPKETNTTDTSSDNNSSSTDNTNNQSSTDQNSGNNNQNQGSNGSSQTTTTYLVTFITNGGSPIDSQNVESGKTITSVATTRNNYNFSGWYKDSSLTTPFNTSTPITGPLTLYAKWTSNAVQGEVINNYSAYNEGAYITFKVSNQANANNSKVSYSQDGINWTDIDSELIRYDDNSKTARADILGLKSGSYLLKVDNNEKVETTSTTINVSSDDRSGYAFFNNDNGIGAYNNDGTLKNNAVVVYVTNANKNTVTAKIGSNTYTGLANIIKNANSSYPLDIRILDSIKTNQYKSKSDAPRLSDNSNLQTSTFFDNELETTYGNNLVGLTVTYMDKYAEKAYKHTTTETGLSSATTSKSSKKTTTYKGSESAYSSYYGKTVYDDDSYFNMLDIESVKNVTIEGVGSDAEIFQWGFTWKSCESIEIKNLTFTDYPEDACSFDNTSLKGSYWIHNNTFNRGKNNWDISGERDKYAGDGGMDLKYTKGVTASYNHYYKCKKTGLVGGGDSDKNQNITFHHNYYENVESRLPLGRQANMHIYNNYYYNCGTCQDIRANAFVFSEYNYFKKCSTPQKITRTTTSGTSTVYPYTVIKSFNDYYDSTSAISGSSSTKDGITTTTYPAEVVSTRDAEINGLCKPDGSTNYTNFDTDTLLFYYDSTNKKSNVTIMNTTSELPTLIPNIAGAGKFADFGLGDFSDINTNVETFTVNFETNGGTPITSQTVASGSTIKSVSTTRSGYTFKGWYTNSGLTSSFDVSTPITSTLTLYAKWEQNSSSQATDTIITFNNFTTGSITSNTTVGNTTITIKADKKININETSTTINGNSITKYVYFDGGGNYSQLSVQFTTTATANITVYYAGNADRKVGLYNESGNVTEATTLTTGAGNNNIVNYTFTSVGAGNYAVASTNKGIEIYAIVITY